MPEIVEVVYAINGTTKNDRYTCDKVLESQLVEPHPDNGSVTVVRMNGGSDADGPVRTVQYAQAYRVIRRLIPEEAAEPTQKGAPA